MQEKRRSNMAQSAADATAVKVPVQFWEDLARRDPGEVSRNSLAELVAQKGFQVRFLGELCLVDREERCVRKLFGPEWERVDRPLLELILLVYLLGAKDVPLRNEMITAQQLRNGHFFQGPHELDTRPLRVRWGRDLNGFRRAAAARGGQPIEAGDAGFRIQALPRVPIYYLLWEGDEEFEPRASILFDRSIESHLSADAIWGLVQLVSSEMIAGPP